MKKIYLSVLGIFASVLAFGQSTQIPNSGFETWTNSKSIQNWQSTNDIVGAIISGYQNVYQETTLKAGGTYSVKLKCQTIPFTSNKVPGIITDGSYPLSAGVSSFNINNVRPRPWIYSTRPDSLIGYYAYTQAGSDTATIGLRFFKGGAQIGEAKFEQNATVSSMTRFAVPINWIDGQIPDSVFFIASTGGTTVNTDGTTLYLDNIGFTGLTSIKKISTPVAPLLSVSPIPAKDHAKIQFVSTSGIATLEIINALGALVYKGFAEVVNGDNEVVVNTANFNAGIYFVSITTPDGKMARKFIKE